MPGRSPKELKSPEKFLAALGIRAMSETRAYGDDYAAMIKKAGGTPPSRTNTFSSLENSNAQFITEEVARRTLGGDFKRIVSEMRAFREINGFPSLPHKIVDLGGGSGIFGMWLAIQHPTCKVVVYDRAPGPLKIGRKWAQDLNINNIEFLEASYAQLATTAPTNDCELVLMYHAFDLAPSALGGTDVWGVKQHQQLLPCNDTFLHVARAMANMLREEGMAVVTAPWTEWGLCQFFEAIRMTNLSIDWPCSLLRGELKNNRFAWNDYYIFLRNGAPRLAETAWEEARAFVASGELYQKLTVFHEGLLESYSNLFSDGKQLLVAEWRRQSGGVRRIRLWQKSGLLLLEQYDTDGLRYGNLHSLAAISDFLAIVADCIQQWKKYEPTTAPVIEVHPLIKPFWNDFKV